MINTFSKNYSQKNWLIKNLLITIAILIVLLVGIFSFVPSKNASASTHSSISLPTIIPGVTLNFSRYDDTSDSNAVWFECNLPDEYNYVGINATGDYPYESVTYNTGSRLLKFMVYKTAMNDAGSYLTINLTVISPIDPSGSIPTNISGVRLSYTYEILGGSNVIFRISSECSDYYKFIRIDRTAACPSSVVNAVDKGNGIWEVGGIPYSHYMNFPNYFVGVLQARTVISFPPDPEKEGHTFTGWYLDVDCTNKYTESVLFADTVLYAGFEINKYTVTFDTDGGGTNSSVVTNWNTSVENNLPTVSKTGYNFLGWYMPNGTAYVNQPITSDMKLTAKWEIIRLTVTFMIGSEVYQTVTCDYGTAFSVVAAELNNNYKIKSMQFDDSVLTDSVGDIIVTSNSNIIVEKSANMISDNFNYVGMIVGGGSLVILIALIATFVSKSKKQYKKHK